MKLVRNLGHYSEHYNFLTYTYNSCLNLNNWIYNSMKKHNIRENIINKCFKEYDDTVKGMRENPTCFYYDYDKTYEEPMNIIMLNMFSSKIDVFKNILEGKIDLVHCSCQKFIKDVVSIYKYMKNTYCSNDRVMLNSKTCQELTSFERSYQFLYNNAVVKAKIPLLKYEKDVNLLGCESDISLQGRLSIETHKTQKHDKRTPAEEPGETSPPPQFDENNDSSNPMSPTVSTALGTVAGASSILALLYKVNKEFHLNV
ncbi:hypothetical protein PVBG_05202 [Plasmodium vivax Brazil I]|uniref:Uncharacterized protein n=1 Tax=Plasmodium vivax (strain Brazil I) TaxID=1033975 RepID=A0A0J9SMJ4_PLAV1|nr:hypothetical protein PVBG_05202 [Plasmodium vivax Brazil I]